VARTIGRINRGASGFKSSKLAVSSPARHTGLRSNAMAQTDNPFLDGLAKAFTDAAGMAQGVRTEIDTFVKQRLERLVAEMDFVPREEFEAVKAMAAKARTENEALAARLEKLEEGAALEAHSKS
jgi:BMFP domain-containing protein YqiC